MQESVTGRKLESLLPPYESPPPWIPPHLRKGHMFYDNDIEQFLPRILYIRRQNSQSTLGFHIRGGKEYHCAIYVSKVIQGSEAERVGLCEGDQILAVNGVSFENLSHSEAVRVLTGTNEVEITVKYFPYGYRRSFDRTNLIADIQDQEKDRKIYGMATRAAAFSSKIRNLKDYHYRIINNLTPQPSGVDVANTLKYFSQTLLSVLKDVPPVLSGFSFTERQQDFVRSSLFPSLNYSGLYQAVISILDIVPQIHQGQMTLGVAVLNVLGCLVSFIENEVLDTLPFTVASTLAFFPVSLQYHIISLLCNNLLPITLGYYGINDSPTYASNSVASILMLVYQHVENPAYHSRVLECFMSYKKNVVKDLLMVIAYGPPAAKTPAVVHLFHYWPQMDPALTDKRGKSFTEWTPILCQKEGCLNKNESRAVKMCMDPTLVVQCSEQSPPLYLCVDCAHVLRHEHEKKLIPVLKPLERIVSLKCENKNCMSPKNNAISTCFSNECASILGCRPIRLCQACHELKHDKEKEKSHIYAMSMPDLWSSPSDMQWILVEAIVSLLKEAEPIEDKRKVEMGEERLVTGLADMNDDDAENDANIAGNALEKLKPNYICAWLKTICRTHLEVVISCLLPHPCEYAKVGGHWETLSSRTSQIKEGLNRLFCLVPYDIVTFEVWDYVMPFWMEAIRTEIPRQEQMELKVLLCKVFDVDMCPLSFDMEHVYHFISEKFENTSSSVQEQTLLWLQILSLVDIIVPLHILLDMFQKGVQTMKLEEKDDIEQEAHENLDEPVENVTCYLLMLDITLKQIEMQSMSAHMGVYNETSKQLMLLLTSMISTPWQGKHTCDSDTEIIECKSCENGAIWHQIAYQLLAYITPRDEIQIPEKDIPRIDEIHHNIFSKSDKETPVTEQKVDDVNLQLNVDQQLPHLQLLYALLQELSHQTDADALFYLLHSLRYLCLHGECLNYGIRDNEMLVKHCLKTLFIPRLLEAKHSTLGTIGVPLLLHCLTIPSGADVFWHLVEEDFTSEDWTSRFSAVEKVVIVSRLIQPETIMNNHVILTAIAHATCYLIDMLNDVKPEVAQRTLLYLDTIKTSSLKFLMHALEFQFDSVISDRSMIMQRIYLLFVALRNKREVIGWEFFLSRFDTLCLEAQLDLDNSVDASSVTGLSNNDRQSEHFLRKLNRARFALARTNSIRSLSGSLKPPYRRAASVPHHLLVKNCAQSFKDKEKHYPRQQSAPQFNLHRNPRGSKFGLSMFSNYPGTGHLREFTDEESKLAALLQRAMELEGVDSETVHMLVTFLMKFMTTCDVSKVNEDKNTSRVQGVVLRHLNVLLGYNQIEKSFSVPPYKLRNSAVFNAFLAGLPHVLDRNFALGNIIFPIAYLLLKYCASPQRYASDYQPPNYTLWLLDPHCRLTWLQTFLVILYKYQYSTAPANEIIPTLMQITINTVDAHMHQCKEHDETMAPPSPFVPRHRDTSNVSVGDLENIQETDTPPQSPSDSQSSTTGGEACSLKAQNIEVISDTEDIKVPLSAQSSTTSSKVKKAFNFGSPTLPRNNALSIASPSEAVDALQREQPRRLAEYNAGSGSERTFKQSVEEFMMKSISKMKETSDKEDVSPTILKTPEDHVEQKMVEQIEEFEKKQVLSSVLSCTIAEVDEDEKSAEKSTEKSAEDSTEKPVEKPPDEISTEKLLEDTAKQTSKPKPFVKIPSASFVEMQSKEFQPEKITRQRASSAKEEKVANLQDNSETEESPSQSPRRSMKPNFRQRKQRKTGLKTIELQKMFSDLEDGSSTKSSICRKPRKSELLKASSKKSTLPQNKSSNQGETVMVERCPQCHSILEKYDDDTISLAIVCMSCFIHREPVMAAPLLFDMLNAASRIAAGIHYSWQNEIPTLIIPGNCVSVARQFIRCTLHQLSPNGIFSQLIVSQIDNSDLLKTIATALIDFQDLNCFMALQSILEGVNEMKNINDDQIINAVQNLAVFMDYVAMETQTPTWNNILPLFDIFFRRLPQFLPTNCEISSVFKIMIQVLKVPSLSNFKTILEPFSKMLSFAIQNCRFKLQQVLDICSLANRAYAKERDKLYLTRGIIVELIQALKFRVSLPDENLILLVQFVCLDLGGTVGPTAITEDLSITFALYTQSLVSTGAADCMKQYTSDCVEFVADLHTIYKIGTNASSKTGSNQRAHQNLNEDTLGSQLKAGIAQYIALEFTRSHGRDNKAVISRYMPWLYHPPSAMQQGPKEFIDCVSHIRLLSWLLLGALTHTAVTRNQAPTFCQPIPLDASCHIADHIMVVLTGFAEQSKASVLHMSSLFHAFVLCQLWTVYCECSSTPEQDQESHTTIMDFWGRVTPGALQLLSHSKVHSEMVNLHILSLMEALQDVNSPVLAKLFPMWTPILYSHHKQLPGHMQVRLQMCQNWEPRDIYANSNNFETDVLLKWLKRLQFKLGQIEVQSSAATQFYTV
ncbi:DgyrCDS4332 [Dimorphilus gyrociliatus]|uniref:DgyrCDS4332 n=1 Tax=Dimorphilus gyrociliatus TaxID=2664684 RepID=A0A7I8VG80_9ANNE|nr:DgyrCDS4332 [Dimorphilus gyrociliatus]